ncbi:effector of transcription2, ARABIDOPSIS EFFECTOR OF TRANSCRIPTION2 [Hibiscus trionum]|uniref:Effector of transcription2, ARABIDOPSIS EFFECTOR OF TRANSCRIPTION2 n=1 Tax=Hibiscus trionum TaxID=183268 RepID=A0A9W7I6Q3_HIBTR|nr:effector of transcription2, ARABIDOPSIS EFFECTOR OF TRANSCRIPTION2 [Hibiscus trionum]
MGAARLADVVTRFNREDHKRTKHDSHFSKWKILIGPHDWEDHSAGKEGVARYRVENLPKTSSSGLYELAIYPTDSSTKLDPNKALVVYLGEADNIRTRLQQYGRTGAHLGRNGSADQVCGCFEDIFARGYSVVYRWAPMENKADARRTESQLLNTFDYAWNKGSNGVRRHEDILQKLDKHASNLTKLANFSRKHLPFLQKQVGIKIKASKLLLDDNEFSKHTDGESRNFMWQVFKFSRSQPRLVSDHGGSDKNDTVTCGVVLEDGSICRRPPAKGRKRCAEHKGKKTKGSSTRSSTSEKSELRKTDYPKSEHCGPICGVAMIDGSLCTRQPASGRKRCDLHKGRRVYSSNSDTTRYQAVSYSIFDSYSEEESVFDKKSLVFDSDSRFDSSNQNNGSNSSSTSICGAPTCKGAPCKRPVNGNERCWQHLNYSGGSISSSSSSFTLHSNYGDSDTSICGAPTHNGLFCQITVKGNGRCWQH